MPSLVNTDDLEIQVLVDVGRPWNSSLLPLSVSLLRRVHTRRHVTSTPVGVQDDYCPRGKNRRADTGEGRLIVPSTTCVVSTDIPSACLLPVLRPSVSPPAHRHFSGSPLLLRPPVTPTILGHTSGPPSFLRPSHHFSGPPSFRRPSVTPTVLPHSSGPPSHLRPSHHFSGPPSLLRPSVSPPVLRLTSGHPDRPLSFIFRTGTSPPATGRQISPTSRYWWPQPRLPQSRPCLPREVDS